MKKHRVINGRWVMHGLRLRGGYWRGRVRDKVTGRVFQPGTRETRSDKAEQAILNWIKDRELEEQRAVHGAQPLTQGFDACFRDWLTLKEGKVRASTLRGYWRAFDGDVGERTDSKAKGVLAPEFGSQFLDEITALQVERFFSGLARAARSVGTQRRYLWLLRSFFAWCVSHKLCRENPTLTVKLARGARRSGVALSVSEARRLVAACAAKTSHEIKDARRKKGTQSWPAPKYLQRAVLIALYTGLRRSNVLGLTWGKVDLEKNKITLPADEMKAHAEHVAPLHPVLRKHLGDGGAADEVVLGKDLDAIRKSFKSALGRAGLPETVRWHDLRHSFGTWLGEEHPWAVVQTLLGHRIQDVTGKYVHVRLEKLRQAVESLPDLTARL